jgi:hypothetical protein
MAACGFGRVLIVVKQLVYSPAACIDGITGGKGLRVRAYQIVHAVASGERFLDEVIGIQGIQLSSGRSQGDLIQNGGSIGIEVGAGVQAEPAEQPLLPGWQVAVGKFEGCRDGTIART